MTTLDETAQDSGSVELRTAAAAVRACGPESSTAPVSDRLEAVSYVIEFVREAGEGPRAAAGRALADFEARCAHVAQLAKGVCERSPTVPASDARMLDEASASLLAEAVTLRESVALLSRSRMGLSTSSELARLAQQYENDARIERREAIFFGLAGLASALLATAVLVWGLARISIGELDSGVGIFAAHVVVALPLLAVSYVLFRSQERRAKSAREARRQMRQLASLDPYVAPLPPNTAHLLRAVLAPRLFPRSIDDDDVLRDPVWPTPRELIEGQNRGGVEDLAVPHEDGGGTGGTR